MSRSASSTARNDDGAGGANAARYPRYAYWQWKYTHQLASMTLDSPEKYDEFVAWAEGQSWVIKLSIHDSPPIYRKDD